MSLERMCPERGRPQPRNNCIHLNLCMHPVSQVRVTMMENNHLLLYKLLCKDGDCFIFGTHKLTLREALSSDCLQLRRHFRVKVTLMNSNDSGERQRQVIHNHSSFYPSPFFYLGFPVTKSTVFPGTLEVIYSFIYVLFSSVINNMS